MLRHQATSVLSADINMSQGTVSRKSIAHSFPLGRQMHATSFLYSGQPALHLCASMMGKTSYSPSDLSQASSRKQGSCLWVVLVLSPEIEDLAHDGEVQDCRAHGFKQPG